MPTDPRRYSYSQRTTGVPFYFVFDLRPGARKGDAKAIGRVNRSRTGWECLLYSDPTIIGRGRTKNAAVNDARRQVGD